MVALIRMTHQQMLLQLFDALDKRMENRGGKSVVKGFWQSGTVKTSTLSPDRSPESMRVRSMGFWKASAFMGYGQVDLLSAVLGGNVRVGIYLPALFIDKESSVRDFISRLYDGNPAHIERRIGGMVLFDWIFTDAPFSAEWMLRCTQDAAAYDILENHYLWLVIHFMEGLTRAVSSCFGNTIPIFGQAISASVAESFGLTIMDCFEMNTEEGTKFVTLIKSESGEISDDTMQAILNVGKAV
ncbi:hypothetical protein [Acidithiobacillus thiooxidans]|uniref:hypothetical protein n=1 Tax=Acidithiobacillus thiooxidans TaxID=930 RepID=UPI001C0654CE|nr:hypothetical protein [Acidithiobacillus thiooxidans]MBU2844085.1 hypothetical protein [Acidithiobacillus thiooxidans]